MKKKRWQRWRRSFGRKSRSRLLGRLCLTALVLFVAVFAWGLYRGVRYAGESPALQVRGISFTGAKRVSEGEILGRAGFAAGTSILDLDLDRIREAIETLTWVRHARVQRVWPGDVVISVIERSPIALARIDGRILQVDADGVLLPMDDQGAPNSPILDGLSLDDPEGNRARIEIYDSLLGLIGEDGLSEVHITAAGEVSVVPTSNPILVDLGLDHHLERWQRYLQLKRRIREDFPDARRVDLRYEDRVIIQQSGEQPESTFSWDEEARLL